MQKRILEGQTAPITGAGRAFAERLAALGCHLSPRLARLMCFKRHGTR